MFLYFTSSPQRLSPNYCANSPRRKEFPIVLGPPYHPAIDKTLFSPSNADFNQISSVWAKCRKWQAIHAFLVSKRVPLIRVGFSLTSSYKSDLLIKRQN